MPKNLRLTNSDQRGRARATVLWFTIKLSGIFPKDRGLDLSVQTLTGLFFVCLECVNKYV